MLEDAAVRASDGQASTSPHMDYLVVVEDLEGAVLRLETQLRMVRGLIADARRRSTRTK